MFRPWSNVSCKLLNVYKALYIFELWSRILLLTFLRTCVSPWYDRHSWLGVKYQIIYLLAVSSNRLVLHHQFMSQNLRQGADVLGKRPQPAACHKSEPFAPTVSLFLSVSSLVCTWSRLVKHYSGWWHRQRKDDSIQQSKFNRIKVFQSFSTKRSCGQLQSSPSF